MNKTRLLLACALLLSACASTGTRDGMVLRDGSWYSPGGEGRGDYYTASPRRDPAYDWPWDYSVGLVPFGGYCPVRYRYCVPAWDSPIWYYGPYYGDPYGYPAWVYLYRSPRHPHHDAHAEAIAVRPEARVEPVIVPAAERPQPRAWDERPAGPPRRETGARSSRGTRRGPFSGGGLD